MKEIPRELFARDEKVKINLQREVEIQQLLSYCPYVVNLYHVEELAAGIVMIMEVSHLIVSYRELGHLIVSDSGARTLNCVG